MDICGKERERRGAHTHADGETGIEFWMLIKTILKILGGLGGRVERGRIGWG